jgi:hypothetical protein
MDRETISHCHYPYRLTYIHTFIHTYIHSCALIENSVQETLYDALLTAREVREEWERYDTLYIDSRPPIHTVYDSIANKDTVYVWVHMRHQ